MRSSGAMPTAGSRSANGKRKAGLKHDVEETGPPETQPTLTWPTDMHSTPNGLAEQVQNRAALGEGTSPVKLCSRFWNRGRRVFLKGRWLAFTALWPYVLCVLVKLYLQKQLVGHT